MNAIQIESWAIRVIDWLLQGKPNEDSRVEFKREWPADPAKVARQIAAHANAARGEPILWLIGVDQGTREVIGANHMEASTWYGQIKSCFDSHHAPTLRDLNISYEDKTVVALLLDTERFPFVVKAKDGLLEVPWREGTSTRSANRSDLLKLLVPLQFLPRLEALNGEVSIQSDNRQEMRWHVSINLYLEPFDEMRLVIPLHKCKASLKLNGLNQLFDLSELRLGPPHSGYWGGNNRSENLSKTIESTGDELLVYGPGKVIMSAFGLIENLPENISSVTQLILMLSILPVNVEQPLLFEINLHKEEMVPERSNYLFLWKIEK